MLNNSHFVIGAGNKIMLRMDVSATTKNVCESTMVSVTQILRCLQETDLGMGTTFAISETNEINHESTND